MEAKRKIELGKVYSAKIGGAWLPVRIDKSLGHGRYEGASLPSGQTVKTSTDAVKGDGQTVAQWQAARMPKDDPAAVEAVKGDMKLARATVTAKKSAQAAKDRKPSGLDAAVRVLREAGTAMHCGDVVKTMLDKGYWTTGGKTPAATIYAAIITEIAKKGAASRFRKTGRGQFELTDTGKEAK